MNLCPKLGVDAGLFAGNVASANHDNPADCTWHQHMHHAAPPCAGFGKAKDIQPSRTVDVSRNRSDGFHMTLQIDSGTL